MLRSKKILIVLLVFLILFSSVSKVFASYDYIGKQFPEFPEEFNTSKYKIIVYYINQGKYNIICWDNYEAYFSTKNKGYAGVYNYLNVVDSSIKRYEWTPSEGIIEWTDITPANPVRLEFNGWVDYPIEDASATKQMLYSNFDIYIDDTDTYFFHKTPLLHSLNMQRVIGGNIWQIVIMLIIMTLVVVVCSVGFHKAWRLLLEIFHQA